MIFVRQLRQRKEVNEVSVPVFPEILMKRFICAFAAINVFALAPGMPLTRAQTRADLDTEKKVVEYLKEHVKPGERVIVSDLVNDVFKTQEERKVLERLF